MILDTATSTPITVSGSVHLKATTMKGYRNEAEVFFLVTQNVKEPVLVAWHDLVSLGVIGGDFPVASHITAMARAACRAVTAKAAVDSILAEYSDVVSDKLKSEPMRGPPMKIILKENAIPRRVNVARQVPLRFREEFQKVIDDLMAKGIIVKLGDSEPTEWCSHGFAVPKTPPKVRLVTDYVALNKWVKRPVHPFPAVKDIIRSIPADARVFCKMDAVHGYFQLALDEESSKLTTFLLETGRYRYLRAPMGLSASSDEWCKRSDELVLGLTWAKKIVDDILLWARDYAELWPRIRIILDRCRHWNITVSLSKFEVGEKIFFAGCVITGEGIYPDPAKTKAIRDFPTPQNLTDLRSFLGLAQQLGHYHPDLAHLTAPLRPLLKLDRAWVWLPEHTEALKATKAALVSSTVLKPFDVELPTIMLTDASRLNGIGWALIQVEDDGQRLIICGSRGLTDTQKRYCTTSLEAMAIYVGVRKCDFYLRGLPFFKVVTDHKALPYMFEQDLEEVAIERVQRYRERLSQYCFEVEWVKGKSHLIADALSRYPAFDPEDDYDGLDEEIGVCRQVTMDPALHFVTEEAANDEEYQDMIRMLMEEVNIEDVSGNHPVKEVKAHWDELSVVKVNGVDLLAKDETKLLVPKGARGMVLEKLHGNHTGTSKSKVTARQIYFWPNMSKEIEDMIGRCRTCQELAKSMADTPSQERDDDNMPGSHYGIDLAYFEGQDWVVLMDRYSGYPFAKRMQKINTAAICGFLTDVFLEVGWPMVIRSDNGPQFRGEFKAYCLENNIIHETSAPYNPQSNGLAEAGVKIIKAILKECQRDGALSDFRKRLQIFRNTPRADGFSPSQRFMARNQRTELPCLPAFLQPLGSEDIDKAKDKKAETAERARAHQDAHTRAREPLAPGQEVLVQDQETAEWTIHGVIKEVRGDGQSFVIATNAGKEIVRNLKHVKEFKRPQAGGGHGPDGGGAAAPLLAQSDPGLAPEPQAAGSGDGQEARRSDRLRGKQQVNYADVVRGKLRQVVGGDRRCPSSSTSSPGESSTTTGRGRLLPGPGIRVQLRRQRSQWSYRSRRRRSTKPWASRPLLRRWLVSEPGWQFLQHAAGVRSCSHGYARSAGHADSAGTARAWPASGAAVGAAAPRVPRAGGRAGAAGAGPASPRAGGRDRAASPAQAGPRARARPSPSAAGQGRRRPTRAPRPAESAQRPKAEAEANGTALLAMRQDRTPQGVVPEARLGVSDGAQALLQGHSTGRCDLARGEKEE